MVRAGALAVLAEAVRAVVALCRRAGRWLVGRYRAGDAVPVDVAVLVGVAGGRGLRGRSGCGGGPGGRGGGGPGGGPGGGGGRRGRGGPGRGVRGGGGRPVGRRGGGWRRGGRAP